jgi:hypothetical protein
MVGKAGWRLMTSSEHLSEMPSERVEEFALAVAHAIVGTLIEHEKGLPIAEAWQIHEGRCRRSIAKATHQLLSVR